MSPFKFAASHVFDFERGNTLCRWIYVADALLRHIVTWEKASQYYLYINTNTFVYVYVYVYVYDWNFYVIH